MGNSFRQKLKYFVSESVKPRTLGEYRALITRGMEKDMPEGRLLSKPAAPWLWLRVLALGLIIFSFTVLAFRLDGNSIDRMTAIVYGALPFNLAVLVFFYELYPKRDLSLALLLFIVVVGGALSCVLISLGYSAVDAYTPSSPWLELIFTGFWEELSKALIAVAAILLLKNRNPFYCFLIGFAVGTGYSYLEDLGYILSYSGGHDTLWLILMSVGRGLSCGCSHAPWTGIICWAFAYFKKPFLNFRFYLTVLFSMVLHYFADIPFYVEGLKFLEGLNFGWLIEIVVVGAIWTVVYAMLKRSYKELNLGICGGQTQKFIEELPPTALTLSKKYGHAANVTALLCALLLSVINLVGCAVDAGLVPTYDYYTDAEFIEYIECGLNLKSDWERQYNAEQEDFSYYVYDGKKQRAVQRDIDGEYEYYYYYNFYDDGSELRHIAVKIAAGKGFGGVYYCNRIDIYENYIMRYYPTPSYSDTILYNPPEEENPEEPSEPGEPTEPDIPEEEEPVTLIKTVSFYAVNGELYYSSYSGYYYDLEKGFTVRSGERFENLAPVISLGAAFAVIAAGGTAAVIILKKKGEKQND